MAKPLLVFFLFLSFQVRADLFDFGSKAGGDRTKLPQLVEKLKGLDVKDDPAFDDSFNQIVKAIEVAVEEEKLYCFGEAADSAGKTIAPGQKQLCIRDLKKHYLDANSVIFDVKKKYLGLVHQRQIEELSAIQKKARADIEKNF